MRVGRGGGKKYRRSRAGRCFSRGAALMGIVTNEKQLGTKNLKKTKKMGQHGRWTSKSED